MTLTSKQRYVVAGLSIIIVFLVGAWMSSTPESPLLSPRQSSTPLARWKTYRNESYKFEIQYPPGTAVTVSKDHRIVSFNVDPEARLAELSTFRVIVRDNPGGLSAKEWVQWLASVDRNTITGSNVRQDVAEVQGNIIPPRKEIMVGAIPGLEIHVFAFDYTDQHTYVTRDELAYKLAFPSEQNPNNPHAREHHNVFKTMLDTFKLLE